jgi:hypothetical protein
MKTGMGERDKIRATLPAMGIGVWEGAIKAMLMDHRSPRVDWMVRTYHPQVDLLPLSSLPRTPTLYVTK